MSSNKTSFTGYCCRLARVDNDTQAEPSTSHQPYSTIVKLSGLPLDEKQLRQLLPGLALMKNFPTTEYALLTTHSLIPRSSDLNLWKFSEELLGAKKTLDKYVSGVISCCGEDSGFVVPGPTTAREHGGKKCKLGLNFTILFLNDKFKQHYCAQYSNQPNPPCVDISQCKADMNLMCKYLSLHLPQVQVHESVDTADTSASAGSTEAAFSTDSSGTFEVIAGNAAASLSLLVYTEMWCLWTHKWSHLLLPNLQNLSAQPKLILEILIILLERKDEEEEHFLSVSCRDDPDTRLGFLKFLKVLFHHFNGQSKEAITQMTEEVCTQASVPVDNFLSDMGSLCESLLLVFKYCCDYEDMEENPKIVSLVEHCFICANEMLNFQHDQDVVEKVLCTDKFETALSNLQTSCPQTSVILSSVAAFYRKLHAPCRRKLECRTQELCCCMDKFASSEQEREKLQAELYELKKEYDKTTKQYHTLKTQYSAASDKSQKTINMLKESEKRQCEVDSKSKELKAEIEDLRKQLKSEREFKQKLEDHTERLRDDNRKLEDERRKLEEEKRAFREEKTKLEQDNERLKAENEALEVQAKQLTQSGRKLHRNLSDLSGKMHQLTRQRNSKSDSCVVASSVETIASLQEHSEYDSGGINPTTVQSVQATTDSPQKSSQTSPP